MWQIILIASIKSIWKWSYYQLHIGKSRNSWSKVFPHQVKFKWHFMVIASAFPVLFYSDNISNMKYLPLFQGSLYLYKNWILLTFRKYNNVYKLSFHWRRFNLFPISLPTPACDSTQRVLCVFIFLFLVKLFPPAPPLVEREHRQAL